MVVVPWDPPQGPWQFSWVCGGPLGSVSHSWGLHWSLGLRCLEPRLGAGLAWSLCALRWYAHSLVAAWPWAEEALSSMQPCYLQL